MAQQMRVMTAFGPVALGQRRTEKQKLQVKSEDKKAQPLDVGQDWLKAVATSDEGLYHAAIKQAMMLSARRLDLNDALEPWNSGEEEGIISGVEKEVVDEMKVKVANLANTTQTIADIESGKVMIYTSGHRKSILKKSLKQEERERGLLVKQGRKAGPFCCERRYRYFIIKDSHLVIYKSHAKYAKPHPLPYDMSQARVFKEEKIEGTRQEPDFEDNYATRLKVKYDSREDRGKSPLYLYPKNKHELRYWEKSFKLARTMKGDLDRKSLRACVGRCSSSLLLKGWETMFWHFSELHNTRSQVQHMAMMLLHSEVSRGWTKLKIIWDKELHKEKRRKDQQLWAARFLSERLGRLSSQTSKKTDEVREQVVSRIQDRFRNYRDDAIFDRKYPIHTGTVLRSRQSRQGVAGDAAFDGMDCDAALKIIFNLGYQGATNVIRDFYLATPEMFMTRVSAYSNQTFQPSSRLLCVSDNQQCLTFNLHNPLHVNMDDNMGKLLSKATLSNFINLDRISQVVLHSYVHSSLEPRGPQDLENADRKEDRGIWCTVYGPRVAWCKRFDRVTTKDARSLKDRFTVKAGPEFTQVSVGPEDAFTVPNMLGDKYQALVKRGIKSKIQHITISGELVDLRFNLSDPWQFPWPEFDAGAVEEAKSRGRNEKPEQTKLGAEAFRRKLLKTEIIVHIMGYRYRFEQDHNPNQEGQNDFGLSGSSKSFQARIPIACDDLSYEGGGGTVLIDNSQVTIKILQTFAEPSCMADSRLTYRQKVEKSQDRNQPALRVVPPTGYLDIEKTKSENASSWNVWTKEVLNGAVTMGEIFGVNEKNKEWQGTSKDGKKPDGTGGSKTENYANARVPEYTLTLIRPDGSATEQVPDKNGQIPAPTNFAKLRLATSIQNDSQDRDGIPVSPEFVGAGMYTSMYTSHKGAWYDSVIPSFRLDHVANFVELSIQEFHFPDSDRGVEKDGQRASYRIRASVNGITTVSPPLHRVQEGWWTILGKKYADPYVLSYQGVRLCLPLPPGCWVKDKRPKVDVEIIRSVYEQKLDTIDYKAFEGAAKQPRSMKCHLKADADSTEFHGCLAFDRLQVDEQKHVSLFMEQGEFRRDNQVCLDVHSGLMGTYLEGKCNKERNPFEGDEERGKARISQTDCAMLNIDFTLRDRDYVRATLGKPGDQRTLCVGDKALLYTEENMVFPKSNIEFKSMFAPGAYELEIVGKKMKVIDRKTVSKAIEDALRKDVPLKPGEDQVQRQQKEQAWFQRLQYTNKTQTTPTDWRHPDMLSMIDEKYDPKTNKGWSIKLVGGNKSGAWKAGLRDPALSHEFDNSGLAEIVTPKKIPYRPSIIPNYCTDVIPTKFCLPSTEMEFRQRNLPGIWPDVVSEAKGKYKGDPVGPRELVRKLAVENISKNWRNIPVTLLAMYPDGTCDLELCKSFIGHWRNHPSREHCLPGKLTVRGDNLGEGKVNFKFNPRTDKTGTLAYVLEEARHRAQIIEPDWQHRVKVTSNDGKTIHLTWQNGMLSNDFSGWEDKTFPLEIKILEPVPRAYLMGVPSILLSSVHTSGFHIYDARFRNTEDVRKAENVSRNFFNPRGHPDHFGNITITEEEQDEAAVIKSGPLPACATSGSCQFEWALHVRSHTETEMYRFVAMLRQSTRLSQFMINQRAKVYEEEYGKQHHAPVDPQVRRAMQGGQLEIVLVEARRLEPAMLVAGHKLKEAVSDMDGIFSTQKDQLNARGPWWRSTPRGHDIDTFVNFRMRSNGHVISVKSQRHLSSTTVQGTSSPSWAEQEGLEEVGGFTFKTGHLEPEKLADLVIEFEVKQDLGLGNLTMTHTHATIGAIQMNVNSRPNLIDNNKPFWNIWLPLYGKTQIGQKNYMHKSGELHIMTRWTPAHRMHEPQPSMRSSFMKELWPKLNQQRLKEPVYLIEPQHLAHYNPNLCENEKNSNLKEDDHRHPPVSLPEFMRRHCEAMYNELKYIECLDRKQGDFWKAFEDRLRDQGHTFLHLGDLRGTWSSAIGGDKATLQHLQDLLERGIPAFEREKRWLELTYASYNMYATADADADPRVLAEAAEKGYRRHLENGIGQSSDSNLQLQEDCFHLSSWESSVPVNPEAFDFHLRRIKRAQNVCTALIADQESGIAYCESLLILAFFLLLPQGVNEIQADATENSVRMSESSAYWILHSLATGAYRDYYGRARSTRASSEAVGAYTNYAVTQEPLCVTSGALADVCLLESCLAYHEPKLWAYFNKLGFQIVTVFYGAFMRLFATYMPTATVFRFWDVLLPMSADPTAEPNARIYLVDLAFGVLKLRKEALMVCQSAVEIRACVMEAFGLLYDASTVIDITKHYHKFLWTLGAGMGAKLIEELCEQRNKIFKLVDTTTEAQNNLLKMITHISGLGEVRRLGYKTVPQESLIGTAKEIKELQRMLAQSQGKDILLKDKDGNVLEGGAKSATDDKFPVRVLYRSIPGGVTTNEVNKYVVPALKASFAQLTTQQIVELTDPQQAAMNAQLTASGQPAQMQNHIGGFEIPTKKEKWAMHRPMPLVGEILSEGNLQKATTLMKESIEDAMPFINFREVERIPTTKGPGPFDSQRDEAMDPAVNIGPQVLQAVLRMEIPQWEQFAIPLYEAFTNRRDLVMRNKFARREQQYGWFNLFGFMNLNKHEKIVEDQCQMNLNVAPSVSMNEIYTSLICCSRGTLGAKASAFFEVYGYNQPGVDILKHNIPTNNLAKGVTRVEAAKKKISLPPPPEKEHENALHFAVWSNHPQKHTLMGSVFIPKLGQFEGINSKDIKPITYNIWGSPIGDVQQALEAGKNQKQQHRSAIADHLFHNPNANEQRNDWTSNVNVAHTSAKEQICIGTIDLGIIWLPEGHSGNNEGQLVVNVTKVFFYEYYVFEANKKNPYVTLHTYMEDGRQNNTPLQIDRWDNRQLIGTDEHRSWLTTHGAFGDKMFWMPTMKQGWLHREHFKNFLFEKDMGWVPEKTKDGKDDKRHGSYNWNSKWGVQYSVPKFHFQSKFSKKEAKKNVVDLMGVRRIVQSVLQRSRLHMSNRQMVLTADTLFSRSGTVPGILEAVLVDTSDKERPKQPIRLEINGLPAGGFVDTHESTCDDWSFLKQGWGNNFMDVTEQIVLEHERQVQYSGKLNLFTKDYLDWYSRGGVEKGERKRTLDLQSMGIRNLGLSGKTLWIRYVRAGDGERCTQGVCFSARTAAPSCRNACETWTGTSSSSTSSPGMNLYNQICETPDPEVFMDLPKPCLQSWISREEFISCMMQSPLLGETIRRIGATDHVLHPKRPISLDVTIADPHREEEDDLFQDAINVQQSILLEVWDADLGQLYGDFLGECWLPPLEQLTSYMKDYVLTLCPYNDSDEAERGASRPTRQKKITGVADAKNAKITGQVMISAKWVYPKYSLDDEGKLIKAPNFEHEADVDDSDIEDKDPASLEARAMVQEGLHTGQLTIVINGARNLRRADASRLSFMKKECDAFVEGWRRNDVKNEDYPKGRWYERKMFRTTTAKNTKNPTWKSKHKTGTGEKFSKEIQAGAFEAAVDEPDGIIEITKDKFKDTFMKKTARREEEEDQVAALERRAHDEGLKLKFGVAAEKAKAENEVKLKAEEKAGQAKKEEDKKEDDQLELGVHHGMEVYMGDTIREFKQKVTEACKRECAFWKGKGSAHDAEMRKYADITISYRHLVMIFVYSAKVQQMVAQDLTRGKEYRHQYEIALLDPSSWEPLDPTRSFHQYPQYAFDSPQAHLIKIVEATESYKLRNVRYKEFLEEQDTRRYVDTDEEKQAYGYAKYIHKADGTEEWRPALIKLPNDEQAKKGERQYVVDWCFRPGLEDLKDKHAGGSQKRSGENKAQQDEKDAALSMVSVDDVILAPRIPKMGDNFDPAHLEVLQMATTLRQMGKNDWEIEADLNKQLTAKWTAKKKAEGGKESGDKPPKVTVDIIQTYVKRQILIAQQHHAELEGPIEPVFKNEKD
jgi:hypothetical protein